MPARGLAPLLIVTPSTLRGLLDRGGSSDLPAAALVRLPRGVPGGLQRGRFRACSGGAARLPWSPRR
eukprot:13591172-Alexandrium_andersonii.AAC.1